MKQFILYFKDFHKEYFNIKLYSAAGLTIAILITFNYIVDLEDSFVDSFLGRYQHGIFLFLIHSFCYYTVLWVVWILGKTKLQLTNGFWWKSLLGFALLALDRSVCYPVMKLVLEGLPYALTKFYYEIFFNACGWVTIALAFWFVKMWLDPKENFGIYGLRFKNVNFTGYFIILLIMIPVIFVASYMPDFIDYYPTYKRSGGYAFADYYKISERWMKIAFEFFYVTDFVTTELFFRGFLVIGLIKYLGKDAVIPMTATYAALHFGKPLAETISSVFGGYILGIFALYSRNIWGGVFIHGGIALSMEVFAFLKQ